MATEGTQAASPIMIMQERGRGAARETLIRLFVLCSSRPLHPAPRVRPSAHTRCSPSAARASNTRPSHRGHGHPATPQWRRRSTLDVRHSTFEPRPSRSPLRLENQLASAPAWGLGRSGCTGRRRLTDGLNGRAQKLRNPGAVELLRSAVGWLGSHFGLLRLNDCVRTLGYCIRTSDSRVRTSDCRVRTLSSCIQPSSFAH